MLGKVYTEILESGDTRSARALLEAGSPRLGALFYALVPSTAQELASYTVYRWECAVRASVVMGFVGAGGLGQLMDQSMKMLNGGEASTILLTFLALVIVGVAMVGLLAVGLAAAAGGRVRLLQVRPDGDAAQPDRLPIELQVGDRPGGGVAGVTGTTHVASSVRSSGQVSTHSSIGCSTRSSSACPRGATARGCAGAAVRRGAPRRGRSRCAPPSRSCFSFPCPPPCAGEGTRYSSSTTTAHVASTAMRARCALAWREASMKRLTDAMDGRASPRKPSVPTDSRSSSDAQTASRARQVSLGGT